MMTWVIVGAVILLALGLVSSQLFRLKDWLDRQPAVPNPDPDSPPSQPEQPGPGTPH